MTNDGSPGIVVGPPGSGRSRYACAMALYQAGQISAARLETYRVAAGNESPVALFAERGLALPSAMAPSPPQALQCLLEQADRYIATLPGPGLAEVRSGLAEVRSGLAWARVAPPVPLIAARNPVVAVAAALAPLSQTHPALAQAISTALPWLGWITYDAYPVDQIGPDFGGSHAFASLVGAGGNLAAGDFDPGLS